MADAKKKQYQNNDDNNNNNDDATYKRSTVTSIPAIESVCLVQSLLEQDRRREGIRKIVRAKMATQRRRSSIKTMTTKDNDNDNTDTANRNNRILTTMQPNPPLIESIGLNRNRNQFQLVFVSQ